MVCPSPVWLEKNPEWCFLIFWIFLLFFLECSSPGRVGMKLGTKIFLISFLACPDAVWLEIKPEWCFYTIFFGMLYPGSGRNGTRNENFLICFSTSPGPVWLEIKREWCFLVFWIFILFFLGNVLAQIS